MILDSFKLTTDSNSLILFVWHKEPRATSHHKQREKEEVHELLLALVSDCQCTSHASLTWQQRKLGSGGGAYELCGICRHLPQSLISPRRSQDTSHRSKSHLCKRQGSKQDNGDFMEKTVFCLLPRVKSPVNGGLCCGLSFLGEVFPHKLLGPNMMNIGWSVECPQGL